MKRIAPLLLIAGLSAFSFAGVDFVATGTWDGNTPRWNRPLADGSALSGIGIDNVYTPYAFTVSLTGSYTMELGNPNASAHNIDTFLILYQNSFSPTNQLTNFVMANDDNSAAFVVLADSAYKPGALKRSSMSANLTAGTQYILVATTFYSYDPNFDDNFGDYGVGIGHGPGDVRVGGVPEPATLAVLGLGALALRRRRKA